MITGLDHALAWPFFSESIGFAAGSLTTFCWVPQALRIIRTRDTRAISLVTQAAFTLGSFLWTIFGLKIGSPSIVLFNTITTLLAVTITVLKLRFG